MKWLNNLLPEVTRGTFPLEVLPTTGGLRFESRIFGSDHYRILFDSDLFAAIQKVVTLRQKAAATEGPTVKKSGWSWWG